MADNDSNQVVYEFEYPGRGTVRASVSEFRRKTYLDLRLWVENEAGELVPTRKGVSVHQDYLPELREAVQALADAIEPRELETAAAPGRRAGRAVA